MWNGTIICRGSSVRDATITIHTELQYLPEYENDTPVDGGGIAGTQVTIKNNFGSTIAQGQTNSSGDFIKTGVSYPYYYVTGIKNFNNFSNSWVRILNGDTKSFFNILFYSPGYTRNWCIDETNVYHHVTLCIIIGKAHLFIMMIWITLWTLQSMLVVDIMAGLMALILNLVLIVMSIGLALAILSIMNIHIVLSIIFMVIGSILGHLTIIRKLVQWTKDSQIITIVKKMVINIRGME